MGNEPDHYIKKGYRPLEYSYSDYLVEFDTYYTWIKSALLDGSPPILTEAEFPLLIGPSFASTSAYNWLVLHMAEFSAFSVGKIQELGIHR